MRPNQLWSLLLFPEKFYEISSIPNEKSFSIRRDCHHVPNLSPFPEDLAQMLHRLLFIIFHPYKSKV